MAEVLTDYDQPRPKKPTFLIVLCILTFVGSGYLLLSNGLTYSRPELAVQVMREAMEKQSAKTGDANTDKMMDRINSSMASFTVENVKNNALIGLSAAGLCILGAILMLMLKKPGFYVYLLGTVACVGGPLYIFGSANFVAILMSVIWGIGGIVFTIMYAVNLKHMR